VLVAGSWRSELPSPVAGHFGPSGPDQFGSVTELLRPGVVITTVLALGMWAVAYFRGQASMTRRIATGIAVGAGAFLALMMLALLDRQRGLRDAVDATSAEMIVTVALLIGFAVGALAAAVIPGDRPDPARAPVPADAERIALGRDERAAWVQHTSDRWPWVVGCVVFAPTLVLGAVLRAPLLAVPAVLALLAFLAATRFTVVVDRTGLVVRSVLGFPRFAIPADEVEHAEEVPVHPVADFGGRVARTATSERTGIIMRRGPALQVTRTGRRVFVITVDDAATGAALLNTVSARCR
jgi:hypothetical protein